MVEVGRGEGHGIDALVFEHLADVSECCWTLLARRLNHLAAVFNDRLIDVAERRDLDVGNLQVGGDVRPAATVEPDDGHSDGVVLTCSTLALSVTGNATELIRK